MLPKLILTVLTSFWVVSSHPAPAFASKYVPTRLKSINLSCGKNPNTLNISWTATSQNASANIDGVLVNTHTADVKLFASPETSNSTEVNIPQNGTYKVFAWVTEKNINQEYLVMSSTFDSNTCQNSTPVATTPTITLTPTITPTTVTPSTTPVVTNTTSPTATSTPTVSSTPQVKTASHSSYISRNGNTLVKDGKAWTFTGYNNYMFTSNSYNQCGSILSDSDINSILSEIKSASKGSVIRTWFFQSYVANGDYAPFDRILNLAQAQGIQVIPVLENQWGDCENSGYKSLSWYQGGYKQANGYPLSFENYVKNIVSRYKDNQTIAFWQIMNEAEAKDSQNGTCEESNAASAMKSFADTISGDIKSIDYNHLISLGTMGSGQCGTESNDYQAVQSGQNLDILEYHDYNNNNVAMPGDAYNGLQARIDEAKALNKPIFVGEAGIRSDVQTNGQESGSTTSQTIQTRASDYNAKMSAQFKAGISGFLIWVASNDTSDQYAITPGDPTEKVMASY